MTEPAPLPIASSLQVERAERVTIGRPATMREREMVACDVTIEDLSTTGCRVRGGMELAVGTLISIGIPGTGMHAARVARAGEGWLACAFLLPITAADVERAAIVETVAEGNFPSMRERIRQSEGARLDRRSTDQAEPSLVERLKAAATRLMPRRR